MLARLFRRAPAPVVITEPVERPGAEALRRRRAKTRAADDRALIRATADQMRADMRARGIDKPAIDWSAL
ncbi:hypothetical protein [Novosphingobium sp. ST904]|uniref:hypothetical protein n=1 Tax=Novosphingobium sp. ST904 TaxID=1684385 RepID=UPI0006C8DFB2|nr:hypothetical protein [Novosphingobium sp. ST904]KPH66029.1 hypothetical protein ADT71_08670 [Novosphingobium sp. ST904]TCM33776.1 hypothetical protein EDF59_11992 [Novosphingobium sp. ST904]